MWPHDWHMTWMWWGWPLGVVLLIVLIWALARSATPREPGEDSPETILKRRYARGEIDAEEFQRKLNDLRR